MPKRGTTRTKLEAGAAVVEEAGLDGAEAGFFRATLNRGLAGASLETSLGPSSADDTVVFLKAKLILGGSSLSLSAGVTETAGDVAVALFSPARKLTTPDYI